MGWESFALGSETVAKPLLQIANGFQDGEKRRALLILDGRFVR